MAARFPVVVAIGLTFAGCASQGTAPGSNSTTGSTASAPAPSSPYGPTKIVKSRDGSLDGEVIGSVPPGSKFSKLHIGMAMTDVLATIGGPDGMSNHETGKRWIPFYFGSDARRAEVFYKGEGCLTYTGGNAWGSGDNKLIRITSTQRTDCME